MTSTPEVRCQKTNEIGLVLLIWKECLLISVDLCIFGYHNWCWHLSSLTTLVFVIFGWVIFVPIKQHTTHSILCPEKGTVLSQHVCIGSILLPSDEMQQPTAINHRYTIWRKLGCIVWYNIPHIILDFPAKFRLVYFPHEEVSEERSRNCHRLMGKVGYDVLIFWLS